MSGSDRDLPFHGIGSFCAIALVEFASTKAYGEIDGGELWLM